MRVVANAIGIVDSGGAPPPPADTQNPKPHAAPPCCGGGPALAPCQRHCHCSKGSAGRHSVTVTASSRCPGLLTARPRHRYQKPAHSLYASSASPAPSIIRARLHGGSKGEGRGGCGQAMSKPALLRAACCVVVGGWLGVAGTTAEKGGAGGEGARCKPCHSGASGLTRAHAARGWCCCRTNEAMGKAAGPTPFRTIHT